MAARNITRFRTTKLNEFLNVFYDDHSHFSDKGRVAKYLFKADITKFLPWPESQPAVLWISHHVKTDVVFMY